MMFIPRWTVFASVALLVTATSAWAGSSASSASDDLPPILATAVKAHKLKIIKKFQTAVPGVTGYVIEQGGQHQVVFGEQGYIFMGQLIAPDGENLSETYADKYVPKPDIAKVIEQIRGTGHLVQQGPDDAPLIYVFADPNCTFCHRFYDQAESLVKAGKLQLRWALVGFLKPSSAGRAAAILTASDPVKALAENEAGFDEKSEQGGIAPIESPAADMKAVLDGHYKQMVAAGGSGTPTLLYRQDGTWMARVGAPGTDWLQTFVDSRN